jgi:hypothetical protein
MNTTEEQGWALAIAEFAKAVSDGNSLDILVKSVAALKKAINGNWASMEHWATDANFLMMTKIVLQIVDEDKNLFNSLPSATKHVLSNIISDIPCYSDAKSSEEVKKLRKDLKTLTQSVNRLFLEDDDDKKLVEAIWDAELDW